MPLKKGQILIIKEGSVSGKKWVVQLGNAQHSIETTGGVIVKGAWATTTWESIANGTLQQWQLDLLHKSNYPMTKEESDRRRKSFKEAKTARNIVVVTAEQEKKKGTALLPWQVKKVCGYYKRATCKHVGGCNKQSQRKGLCTEHYNAMKTANLVLSQPTNDELALPEPTAVADWTAADDWTATDREFFMDVMDWDVVTSDFPTPSEWSEELTNWAGPSAWSKLPTGQEWGEF